LRIRKDQRTRVFRECRRLQHGQDDACSNKTNDRKTNSRKANSRT
jgi:hypothetical protein